MNEEMDIAQKDKEFLEWYFKREHDKIDKIVAEQEENIKKDIVYLVCINGKQKTWWRSETKAQDVANMYKRAIKEGDVISIKKAKWPGSE